MSCHCSPSMPFTYDQNTLNVTSLLCFHLHFFTEETLNPPLTPAIIYCFTLKNDAVFAVSEVESASIKRGRVILRAKCVSYYLSKGANLS